MKFPNVYKKPLRAFLAGDFYATRKLLGLTQAQMAEQLDIDPRSYSALEGGEYLCSTRVFLWYMLRCKEDPAEFIRAIEAFLTEVDGNLFQ